MDEALWDVWLDGEPAELMAEEYQRLVAALEGVGERQARRTLLAGLPSLADIVAALAEEALPNGPAPSFADTLHALDVAFAGWQGEDGPFQRVQARRLAYAHGQIALLRQATVGGR